MAYPLPHLYDALYAFKDYAGEAARLTELIRERNPSARTLLDVACGTGKHLEVLRSEFEVEGVDIDDDLLAIARGRLGSVPLYTGDMRTSTSAAGSTPSPASSAPSATSPTPTSSTPRSPSMARHLEPGRRSARGAVAGAGRLGSPAGCTSSPSTSPT